MCRIKFLQVNKTPAERYAEDGYYRERNAIKIEEVDHLLSEFEDFKRSGKIFYSQSDHSWKSSKDYVDPSGLLKSSILDFTDLPWARQLSLAGKKYYFRAL